MLSVKGGALVLPMPWRPVDVPPMLERVSQLRF